MRVYFHTNLDLEHCEKFPDVPDSCIPRVGDTIFSAHQWSGGTQLHLRVYEVWWTPIIKNATTYGDKAGVEWEVRVELNIPTLFQNLTEFYEWYGRVTGKGKHAYI